MAGKFNDTGITGHFLSLLRSGIRNENISSFPELSVEEWNGIIALAKKHTVLGMVYLGVSRLPESYHVPEDISLSLMMESSRIEARSRKVLSVLKEVFSLLKDNGLHPMVLKGPSVARYYSRPELRQSGDLDLYLRPSEFGTAMFLLGDHASELPDGSIHYDWKGVDIDMHRKYFDLHVGEGSLPRVPSPYATLVLLSSHILKHCMGPGIGLRQICDMAVAYDHFRGKDQSDENSIDRDTLVEYYKKAGILEWNRLLSSLLKDYLGGDGYPFEGPLPSSASLMKRIMEGGNFGHHDAVREKTLQSGSVARKFHTLILYLKRMPFSLKYAPREFFHEFGELALGNFRRKEIV
jgi:hypothetical protein